MEELLIAGLLVQVLIMWALCLHHSRVMDRFRGMREEIAALDEKLDGMTEALSAPGVIPEEVSALEKKLEAMAAAPTDNAVVSGFENLMRYGVDTARGAGK